MKQYVIQSSKGSILTYDALEHTISVETKQMKWKQNTNIGSSILIKRNERVYSIPFKSAKSITVTPYSRGYGKGIETVYAGFELSGLTLNLVLKTIIGLDESDKLHMELIPMQESQIQLEQLLWPAPFEWERDNKGYTVVPMMQGCIIPSDWSEVVRLVEPNRYYERAAYMPWWGQVVEGKGYIAVADTPWDGGYALDHPIGGPTVMQPIWYSSLGQVAYNRKLTYTFVDENCDYNTLCKIYRDVVKHQGNLVTLKEKSIRNPNVAKLLGSALIHHCIYRHIEPTSSYYDKEHPETNDSVYTFEQTARDLKVIKDKGLAKAYIHLDGWGKRGYDNLHPDVFPPCQQAGGWEGFKALADECEELGYLMGIHDQYRDYYKDAETFDPHQAVYTVTGECPSESTWWGGEQALLCATLAPEYVRRNYYTFKTNGLKLKGAYLDVFSVVWLDECAHPEHTMTRKECLEKRKECLNYIRGEGLIASSEEVVDWAISCMELCHHAPYALEPSLGGGVARGIPVPLLSLVYGDCITVPWGDTIGGWGIPDGEHGYLHALMNGGIGYLSIYADEEQIKQNQAVGAFNQEVAHLERLRHEFLEGSYKKQRMTFEGGITVTVNFENQSYKIETDEKTICGIMQGNQL